jgi:purine nucleoside permease
MLFSIPTALLALTSVATAALVPTAEIQQRSFKYVIKPKVFIISLFRPEAEIWHGIPEFDILAMNITVPGFSVLVSVLLDIAERISLGRRYLAGYRFSSRCYPMLQLRKCT